MQWAARTASFAVSADHKTNSTRLNPFPTIHRLTMYPPHISGEHREHIYSPRSFLGGRNSCRLLRLVFTCTSAAAANLDPAASGDSTAHRSASAIAIGADSRRGQRASRVHRIGDDVLQPERAHSRRRIAVSVTRWAKCGELRDGCERHHARGGAGRQGARAGSVRRSDSGPHRPGVTGSHARQ